MPRSSKRRKFLLQGFSGGTIRCAYCLEPCLNEILTVDHVIPTSKGGYNGWSTQPEHRKLGYNKGDNIVLVCEKCNKVKNNKYIIDFYIEYLCTIQKTAIHS
jgi:5-methylcytosine-specific restriction endonuclease McrA